VLHSALANLATQSEHDVVVELPRCVLDDVWLHEPRAGCVRVPNEQVDDELPRCVLDDVWLHESRVGCVRVPNEQVDDEFGKPRGWAGLAVELANDARCWGEKTVVDSSCQYMAFQIAISQSFGASSFSAIK